MFQWIAILTAVFSVSLASAREGRGQHETKVKCAKIESLADAEKCLAKVGKNMPTENDTNAVLVTDTDEAKSLLIEILKYQEETADIPAVENAAYLAVVVQNDDESSVYYYVINKGRQVKPLLVGNVISTADLIYDVCPDEEGEESDMNQKFGKVKNLLLGKEPRDVVAGTVWLDDVRCEF